MQRSSAKRPSYHHVLAPKPRPDRDVRKSRPDNLEGTIASYGLARDVTTCLERRVTHETYREVEPKTKVS